MGCANSKAANVTSARPEDIEPPRSPSQASNGSSQIDIAENNEGLDNNKLAIPKKGKAKKKTSSSGSSDEE